MSNILLPCPFCGGRATVKTRYIGYGSIGLGEHDEYRVVCKECNASSNEYRIEEQAIAAWNRRTDHIRDTTEKVSNADTCVCCGDTIPEGRQTCPNCEAGAGIYSGTRSEFAVSKCYACGKEQFSISHVVKDGKYCPNCGAKMESEGGT